MTRITKRVKDNEGNLRGIQQLKISPDHLLYKVSLPNGQTEELTENMITRNMLSQVDSEGHNYQVLKDISDHYADGSALNRSNVFIISHGGNLHAKKTTIGWKL